MTLPRRPTPLAAHPPIPMPNNSNLIQSMQINIKKANDACKVPFARSFAPSTAQTHNFAPSFPFCSSGATQLNAPELVSGFHRFIARLAIQTPNVGGRAPSSTGTRGSLKVGAKAAMWSERSVSGRSGTSSLGRDCNGVSEARGSPAGSRAKRVEELHD